MTRKERAFAVAYAKSGDAPLAARAAGYANPQLSSWRLLQHPTVVEASREVARQFLREKGGAVGVMVLTEIALDDKQPSGARVKASEVLMKSSGIAGDEGTGGKQLHEMDGQELAKYHASLKAQLEAIDKQRADAARPVIDADPVENSPVAPNLFD